MLRDNEIDGVRSVVDVSGDGIETPPESATDIQEINVGIARSLAEANAITVNGLAILNEVAKLDQWYRRNVITGSNSFVMSADDYSQFAAAMRAKLLREIDTGEAITKRSKLHLR